MINPGVVILCGVLLAGCVLGIMYGIMLYTSLVDRFMRYLLGTSTINHSVYTQSPTVVRFLIRGLKFRIMMDAGMYSLQAKVWFGKWHDAELWHAHVAHPTFTHTSVPDVDVADQRLKTIMSDVDVWLANFYNPKFVRSVDGVVKKVKYVEPFKGE